MTARMIWRRMCEQAELHCFDTFEGFAEADLNLEAESLNVASEKQRFKNTSEMHVRRTTAGGENPRLLLIKGFFPESASGFEGYRYRFVHLDVDLHEPIRRGLEFFGPKLVPGGFIAVHDYLSPRYPGVKRAVDDFAARWVCRSSRGRTAWERR